MINRKTAPPISLPNEIDLLEVKELNLKNGLKIHILNGCPEPVINLSIYLSASNYYQEKEFAASFVANLIKKGTKNFSANEIAEQLDFLGASLNVAAGMFKITISLSCLTSKLKDILPIVKDVLTNSIFPEKEIALEKKRKLQSLKINEEKTNFLASIKFNEVIFGENHSCGYRPSVKSIEAVTQADLQKHYKEIFQLNDKSYAVLSGDINEEVIALIDENIGSIKIENKFQVKENPFSPAKEKEYFIKKKDSVQASIRIGMPCIETSHPDYLDLEILNRVLGGYFGSRLMKNIREENGYTYGIYSYLSPFEGGSYFCIATDVGIEYKEATVDEISKEILRLKNELISDEELKMVKNYHKGSIMKSVDGALRLANVLSNNLSFGLDEKRVNEQLKAVENINAERLLSLANKYLDFEDMYKIVVG